MRDVVLYHIADKERRDENTDYREDKIEPVV